MIQRKHKLQIHLKSSIKKEKKEKKRACYYYLDRQEEGYKGNKVKSLIDFDEDVSSVRSLAVKKDTKINLATRFLKGKMLMFCKISVQSFVYDLIDVFMFPDEEICEINNQYETQKCLLYQNLTDTDSTSIFLFLFVKYHAQLMKKMPEILFLKF